MSSSCVIQRVFVRRNRQKCRVCLIYLQMSMSLGNQLASDELAFTVQMWRAEVEEWDIDAKFRLVASRLRAQPMGICFLRPEVEYAIIVIKRIGKDVTVDVLSTIVGLVSYMLPRAYADTVTDADIWKINSGQQCYKIIRKYKKCGPDRLPFGHCTCYT